MFRGVMKRADGREVFVVGLLPANVERLTHNEPVLMTAESVQRGPSYPDVVVCYAETREELLLSIGHTFNVSASDREDFAELPTRRMHLHACGIPNYEDVNVMGARALLLAYVPPKTSDDNETVPLTVHGPKALIDALLVAILAGARFKLGDERFAELLEESRGEVVRIEDVDKENRRG